MPVTRARKQNEVVLAPLHHAEATDVTIYSHRRRARRPGGWNTLRVGQQGLDEKGTRTRNSNTLLDWNRQGGDQLLLW